MKKRVVLLSALMLCRIHAKKEDADKLVSVRAINSHIQIECMYATYNNFTGQQIYPDAWYNTAYLLKHVAQQLNLVQQELERQGFGLLIWDAFRPMEAQEALFQTLPDENYVAHPAKGGRHTRGTTVDLTLISLKTKKPVDMGTGFDVFIPSAAPNSTIISATAKFHRNLLRDVMSKHGFDQHAREWWHFDYRGYLNYPVLDVTYDELD